MYAPNFRDTHTSALERASQVMIRSDPYATDRESRQAFIAASEEYARKHQEVAQARQSAKKADLNLEEARVGLADMVRFLGLVIRAMGGGRRKYEVFWTFFPKGLGVLLLLDVKKLLAAASALISALVDETNPNLVLRREDLQLAYETLVQAETAHQSAHNAFDESKLAREVAAQAWRKALVRFYHDLREVFFDQRKLVEWIFETRRQRKIRAQRGAKEPGDDPPVEGGNGNGTATGTGGSATGNGGDPPSVPSPSSKGAMSVPATAPPAVGSGSGPPEAPTSITTSFPPAPTGYGLDESPTVTGIDVREHAPWISRQAGASGPEPAGGALREESPMRSELERSSPSERPG